MHIAEESVYRNLETGAGYVGRSPQGNCERIGVRGQSFTDEQVAELGLDDLKDHTGYDVLLAAADEAGAPVTFRRDDGSIGVKIKGKEAK